MWIFPAKRNVLFLNLVYILIYRSKKPVNTRILVIPILSTGFHNGILPPIITKVWSHEK